MADETPTVSPGTWDGAAAAGKDNYTSDTGDIRMVDRFGNSIYVSVKELSTYKAKGYAIAPSTMTIAPKVYDTIAQGFSLWYDNVSEDAYAQERPTLISEGYDALRAVLPEQQAVSALQSILDQIEGGGGGGGGRRSGGVAPVYTAPDERTIRETVENQMVALLGKIDDSAADRVTKSYMKAHREAWEGKSIDPNMTILEGIRGLEEYKRIHKLRPDSIRESQWISNQQQALLNAGMRTSEVQERSRDLAQIGAVATGRNAQLAEFSEGFQAGGFFERLDRAAGAAARRLR